MSEFEYDKVASFLLCLSENFDFKSKIISEFCQWIFSERTIKLPSKIKKFLLIGDNNNGLIFAINSPNSNVLDRINILNLLKNILQHEYSLDPEDYISILCELDPNVYLKAMKLDRFFYLNFCNAKSDSCFIIDILDKNINGLDILEILWCDEYAVQEFRKYKCIKESIHHSIYLYPGPYTQSIKTHKPSSLPGTGSYSIKKKIRKNIDFQINTNSVFIPNKITRSTGYDTIHKYFEQLAEKGIIWYSIRIPAAFNDFKVSIRYKNILTTQSEKFYNSIPTIDSEISIFKNIQETKYTNFEHNLYLSLFECRVEFPFPASIVTSVIFDHKSVIQDIITSEWAKKKLNSLEFTDLEKFTHYHWFSKILSSKNLSKKNCPFCHVTSYIFEELGSTHEPNNIDVYRTLQIIPHFKHSNILNLENSHKNHIFSVSVYDLEHLTDSENSAYTQCEPKEINISELTDESSSDPLYRKNSSILRSLMDYNDINNKIHCENHAYQTLSPRAVYYVIPLTASTCQLVMFARLSEDVVYTVSNELLGESPELYQSLWNMIYICKMITKYLQTNGLKV